MKVFSGTKAMTMQPVIVFTRYQTFLTRIKLKNTWILYYKLPPKACSSVKPMCRLYLYLLTNLGWQQLKFYKHIRLLQASTSKLNYSQCPLMFKYSYESYPKAVLEMQEINKKTQKCIKTSAFLVSYSVFNYSIKRTRSPITLY